MGEVSAVSCCGISAGSLQQTTHVAVGELLLELAGEASLDLVESLELGDGDEDDDRLLASLDVDLARGRDLERAELGLKVGNAVLEVEDGLSDEELGRVRGGLGRVGRAEDLGSGRLRKPDGPQLVRRSWK